MSPERFRRFGEDLRANLAARAEVIGLVWMGSAAARDRVDQWSDHDFAVVTRAGAEPGLREDLSWLPDPRRVAMVAAEEHGGRKVVYDDGHVVEFGVTSLAGLDSWYANDYEVVLDRGGVAEAFARVAARAKPGQGTTVERELALFVTALLVGVGRCRRGEVLVASHLVRAIAVGHLLAAWRLAYPPDGPDRRDDLDVFRRFEQAYPEAGRAIAGALTEEVEPAARRLLELAESRLGADPGFPRRGAGAVRARLGWPANDRADLRQPDR